MKSDPFPRRIVTGLGFCNRETERKKLSKLVLRGTHIWLQAHRRHGKSSLLEQVGEDLKSEGYDVALERCHVLFNSGSESIIKQLLKSAARLMGDIASQQAKKVVTQPQTRY
ncbi:hypothetical protein [Vibrio sp. Hal054]|uniref:hypothetical protein n=1 Tax=Vibrio sp. Hal054 TaxID=3035158 RepID=UPI00301D76EB